MTCQAQAGVVGGFRQQGIGRRPVNHMAGLTDQLIGFFSHLGLQVDQLLWNRLFETAQRMIAGGQPAGPIAVALRAHGGIEIGNPHKEDLLGFRPAWQGVRRVAGGTVQLALFGQWKHLGNLHVRRRSHVIGMLAIVVNPGP